MRKKRPIVWTGVAICLALAGAVVVYKPWRDIALIMALVAYTDITKPNDPLTRALRDAPTEDWGVAVALTPATLKIGMTRKDVDKVLAAGKFKPDESREFSWRHPVAFPTDSLFYSKFVDGVPCALKYTVVIRYDDRRTLVEAVGTENEAGCL